MRKSVLASPGIAALGAGILLSCQPKSSAVIKATRGGGIVAGQAFSR